MLFCFFCREFGHTTHKCDEMRAAAEERRTTPSPAGDVTQIWHNAAAPGVKATPSAFRPVAKTRTQVPAAASTQAVQETRRRQTAAEVVAASVAAKGPLLGVSMRPPGIPTVNFAPQPLLVPQPRLETQPRSTFDR